MYNNNQGVQARPTSPQSRGNPLMRVVISIAILAILGAGAFAYYTMRGTGNSVNTGKMASSTSETVNTEALEGIVLRVQKLIMIPSEQPVIYTVDNAKELTAQQAFFTGAEDGDILLVFPKAEKAILYSSARNIIVNVGPITYDNTANAAAATTATTTPTETGTSTPR